MVRLASFWAAVMICGAEQPAELRIRIYNIAAVPALELIGAQSQAAQILATAGIRVEWEEGDPNAADAYELDASALLTGSATARTGLISARILPRAPGSLSPRALGMALPFAARGVHVTLFANRTEEVMRTRGLTWGQVLGSALAHEIGHMLLRNSKHSSAGIMRERWGNNEYVLIAMGRLKFVRGEGQRMRATLGIDPARRQ